MAKFLDKKERVIDFQLTPYGKHRLSVGQLRPEYYAFFDTGVLYDSEYAGFKEVQTKIHERIKTETQFIEGILLFEEAENSVPPSAFDGDTAKFKVSELYPDPTVAGTTVSFEEIKAWGAGTSVETMSPEEIAKDIYLDYDGDGLPDVPMFALTKGAVSMFDLDITPQRYVPKPEILSFESAIGDARFEGDNTQASPAWKLVTCQGEITKVQRKDTTKYNFSSASYDNEVTEFNIPQIDVTAYYTKLISAPTPMLDAEIVSDFVSETLPFKGGNTIKLVRDDITIYAEELNTELLTENFDVEVFEMTEDTGVTTLAQAIISVAATPIQAGDHITISDGIRSQRFEFMANSSLAPALKPQPAAGNVGVIVSSNYYNAGGNVNRIGTILNFLSALNQDNGSNRDWGYPSDYGEDDTGNRNRGRCRPNYLQACYMGNHNLKISIDTAQIAQVISHNFASNTIPFPIKIFNDNTAQGNPNQTIATNAATARIKPSGFSGGYTAKGTQLKRKYFKNENPQVVEGLMISATPAEVSRPELTTDAVDYFFNVLTDKDANAKIVCACANTFNKNSYYVDIDHDCMQEKFKEIYYDIYGSATSPEICQLPAENVNELRDLRLGSDDNCEDDN
tara:strand:- start:3928 stop:5796 length:1869 start_codon:yes stop_codon:yes gene_type:complete